MNIGKLTILVALGVSVTACGGGVERGLESVHQPVVSRADYTFEVNTSGTGLSGNEATRLAGWFDALQLGYGDRVAVDFGGNYDDGAAKASIASVAARYGLLLQDASPLTAGDVAPGAARVVVSRLKASVPSCPEWKSSLSSNFNNKSSSNYGCATNSNLASMVANPEDLVQGQRGDGMTDAAASSKAVKMYRETKPTGSGGLKSETTGGQ